MYLSKLKTTDNLFQQPNPYYDHVTDLWYKAQPVGVGTIGKFLVTISENAGLSYIYTKYCIHGTIATGMKIQGHTLVEIAHILKHKNLQSLSHYLDMPTHEDKENFSKPLFKYTNKTNDSDISDMSDFEPPPPLKKKSKSQNVKQLQQCLFHQKTKTKKIN